VVYDLGDTGLVDHLNESPRNAIYGSSRMQNRILDVIQDHIQSDIVREARSSTYYSILVDTTQVSISTAVSNVISNCACFQDEGDIDQMSLVLRYITDGGDIVEQFLEYVDASNSTTGQSF
jgi:hypothetical protein